MGHRNNAALLGGKDQNFHGNLPVLALGFGRWQRKDINAGVAEASKFAAIAGWDRIVKLAGPAFLVAAGPAQGAHQISKEGATGNLPPAAKSLGTGKQARAMLVGLGER